MTGTKDERRVLFCIVREEIIPQNCSFQRGSRSHEQSHDLLESEQARAFDFGGFLGLALGAMEVWDVTRALSLVISVSLCVPISHQTT